MPKAGDPLLQQRRTALEEEFFRKEDARLRQQLRAEMESAAAREELIRASGISRPEVLDRLSALGLDGETVIALSLVPLIDVAWVDGRMDEPERRAVLAAARKRGIDDATPAGLLLESWLCSPPSPALREAWMAYVRALCDQLGDGERSHLRDDILGRARDVAEAAGGFLGLGPRVSPKELEELQRLETAFGS